MHSSHALHARAKRGFTLIELLTVIVIITILAAIIIPTVGKVRQTTRSAQCVSNLRQNGIAIRAFAADFKGAIPPQQCYAASVNDPFGILSDYNGDAGWYMYLRPYIANQNGLTGEQKVALACPDHETTVAKGDLGNFWHHLTGYAYNNTIPTIGNSSKQIAYLSRIEFPNRFPILFEVEMTAGGGQRFDNYKLIWRHGDTNANMLMLDGSVISLKNNFVGQKPSEITRAAVWAAYPEYDWDAKL